MSPANDPSFVLVMQPDSRRGLWVRCSPSPEDWRSTTVPSPLPDYAIERFELAAGREGDDAEFSITIGEPFTHEHMHALYDCLTALAFAHDTGFNQEMRDLRIALANAQRKIAKLEAERA